MSDYLYLPNRIARYFLLATQEVIGKHGLNAGLSLAALDHYVDTLPPDTLSRDFLFAEKSALNLALEDMNGICGGHVCESIIGKMPYA